VKEILRLTSEGVDVVFDGIGGPYLAFPQGSPSWREGSGLWPPSSYAGDD
jgi:hypothetical protein